MDQKWLPAVPLIQILAMVGIHKAFANPGAGLLLAQGRADIGFYWNIGWDPGFSHINLSWISMVSNASKPQLGHNYWPLCY